MTEKGHKWNIVIISQLRPCQCLRKFCQLGWRSQGGAGWTTNSKIAHCHREKVNWARVVVASLFLKEAWEGREERKEKDSKLPLSRIGYDRLTYRGWQGKSHIGKTRGWLAARGRTKQTGKPYLSSLPSSLSLTLSFFFPLIAVVEERRQTRTEPWTQKLVNPFTFFHFQLLNSYSIASMLCYSRSNLQVFLYRLSFHTVCGPSRSH